MAGYDPQKARGRREIPDDEPAPVDGLLGPAPASDGPTLAHDAARPMVRQVLPVPAAAPTDEDAEADAGDAGDAPDEVDQAAVTDAPAVASTTDEPGAQPELVPDAEPVEQIERVEPTSPSVPTRTGPGGGATTEATGATSSTSSRARVAAIVVAVLALVLLVLWRRRRQH